MHSELEQPRLTFSLPVVVKSRMRHSTLIFLTLCLCASTHAESTNSFQTVEGAITRGPVSDKLIALAFTGHEFADGADTILSELNRHHAKASFFLTGRFLTNANYKAYVDRIITDGHYLGPHSDNHLLYCPWDPPKRTLVIRDEFRSDLETNLKKIERFGIARNQIRFFLPPFEHYNQEIATWSADLGQKLINYTPGTRSNADYTGEMEKNFVSSEVILKSIFERERMDPHGLNGFILLLHIGSGPGRKDKFHATRFGEMMDRLTADGYRFVRVDELLRTAGRVK
jgi:peptidoglycan/xylan/chitin deacetylase (PgdA/CDA1 family)